MRTDLQSVDRKLMKVLSDLVDPIARLPRAEKMVLYGSYAKGTNNDESDVDLAVFFGGDGQTLLEEYRWLVRICMNPEWDIQVQAFNVSELEKPCGIVEEIDMYGIELPLRQI